MPDENDIQHNINFCIEVEQYENLYDYRRSDYCLFNKTLQEESWESIAQTFESNSIECKQRWKNIRAGYSHYMRKVNKFGHGNVQQYYLAPYLSFLDPFMKTRKIKDKSVKKTVDESIIKTEPEANECKENDDNCESVLPDDFPAVRTSQSSAPPAPARKEPRRRRYPSFTFKKDVNPRVYHSPKIKQQLLKIENPTETQTINQTHVDLGFLHSSVRPDMKFMNTVQKRHFKMGFLDLAAQMLATNKVTATTSLKSKVKSP